ncbi:hypothetical protein RHSIM_Rhsim04G0094200 [Rhododendron simsii]|uniref:Uncharacterized protein n=1 Tax=Rhododendron simsii TaxID=118357 RepID=A0A834H0G6_RHOSS|nr:hypothetical protein RHSIM_Rhsim04G0094200 [Rhododendron simsii]
MTCYEERNEDRLKQRVLVSCTKVSLAYRITFVRSWICRRMYGWERLSMCLRYVWHCKLSCTEMMENDRKLL